MVVKLYSCDVLISSTIGIFRNLVPSVAEGPKDGLKMVVDAIRKLMQPMGSTAETIYRRICADNMDVSSSYINVLVKDGINRGLKQNVLLAVTANCFALNGTGNSGRLTLIYFILNMLLFPTV